METSGNRQIAGTRSVNMAAATAPAVNGVTPLVNDLELVVIKVATTVIQIH